jgi:hypothetical protein
MLYIMLCIKMLIILLVITIINSLNAITHLMITKLLIFDIQTKNSYNVRFKQVNKLKNNNLLSQNT